jgi:hypothetical protein
VRVQLFLAKTINILQNYICHRELEKNLTNPLKSFRIQRYFYEFVN